MATHHFAQFLCAVSTLGSRMPKKGADAGREASDAPPPAELELTLRGVHRLRLARDGGGLTLAVENLDTGDKFGRSVCAEDLAALVPDKLKTDMESVDDFEVSGVCGRRLGRERTRACVRRARRAASACASARTCVRGNIHGQRTPSSMCSPRH